MLHKYAPSVIRDGQAIVATDDAVFCNVVTYCHGSATFCAVCICSFMNIAFEPALLPVKKPPIPPINGATKTKNVPNVSPAVFASNECMPDAPINSEMAINIVVVIAKGIHCLIVCESDCLIILDGMRKKIIVNKQVIPSQNPGEYSNSSL